MGVVTLPISGAWADGAFVTLTGPATRSMYVDGTGFYAFIDLLPGTYTITASKPGAGTATTTATIAIGQVTGNMYERNLVLCTPPVAPDKAFTRAAGSGLDIPIADLNAGAPLAAVGSGTQGATITFDSANIHYVPQLGNTNTDTFTYMPVSPCATNGTITINVVEVAGNPESVTVTGKSASMSFSGIPGSQYDVQRSTDLVTWTTITTTPITAPTGGTFTYTDSFVGTAPIAAYYRLVQH